MTSGWISGLQQLKTPNFQALGAVEAA